MMKPYYENPTGKLYTADCIERMKKRTDFGTHLIFCDPPYALGSTIEIQANGKPDYKKAVDFMNKWNMPTGEYWEDWFKEACRMLKHGGYCVMYGIDRQLLMFKYYASAAGFIENQSLYWYFLSSFPKASDMGKMLDKASGVESEVVGTQTITGQCLGKNKGIGLTDNEHSTQWDITEPTSPLGKKYSGYKFCIAPLKQTNETIMVFQKPYKTGSCLHDTIAYEKGDATCMCGALDIENSRCGSTGARNNGNKAYDRGYNCSSLYGQYKATERVDYNKGRYPAQTFIDSGTANLIDNQTGVTGSTRFVHNSEILRTQEDKFFTGKRADYNKSSPASYGDAGGGSKILHKCNYEQEEYDLYHYSPKASQRERNEGLDNVEAKNNMRVNAPRANEAQKHQTQHKNHHPSVKPISLNEKILRLFKLPDPQSLFIPFCGSGSEVIGAIKAGYDDWEAVEINPEYCEIAAQRINYHYKNKPIFEI